MTRAAARMRRVRRMRLGGVRRLCCLRRKNRRLVVCRRFAFGEGDRTRRAGGQTVAQSTPIRDLAKKLHFSLMREGDGDYTRDWTCLTTGSGSDDFSIWLIATGSPAVTEAQMASNGLSPRGKGTCHLLKGSEKNVSIGGITPGMTWNQVLAKFGQPTYVADDDWYFWSTSKTIEEFSNSREQMNWTGVQLEKGKVSRLFSSQATNP